MKRKLQYVRRVRTDLDACSGAVFGEGRGFHRGFEPPLEAPGIRGSSFGLLLRGFLGVSLLRRHRETENGGEGGMALKLKEHSDAGSWADEQTRTSNQPQKWRSLPDRSRSQSHMRHSNVAASRKTPERTPPVRRRKAPAVPIRGKKRKNSPTALPRLKRVCVERPPEGEENEEKKGTRCCAAIVSDAME